MQQELPNLPFTISKLAQEAWSETGSKKKTKIPLEGREKESISAFGSHWFVKEREPVRPNAHGERYTGRKQNR